jgi:Cu2+-exporting ATPase
VANSIAAGRLLEIGILPLNMNALAKLATAKLAVFDKTGTLTDSSLALVGSHYERPKHRAATIKLIKQMMAASEHPIAKAMLGEFGCAEENFIEVINSPGQGLSTNIAGKEFRIGAFDFVQPDLLSSEVTRKKLKMWRCQGYQIIAFSGKAGLSPAYFAFSNSIRQGSAEMINQLRCLGVNQIVIASGDHEENVALLARKLAADCYFSRLMPADKLSLIIDLKKSDQQVIMIGDGINDAPTLAAADVAISLSDATDLAKTNSDFVLFGDDISKIAQLRSIAQQTKKIIQQNIFWAISYNVIAIPAAAAGLVQPWLAALGMSLSALLVVLNSLRLCNSTAKDKPVNIDSRQAKQTAGSLSGGVAIKPM